jgi:DNA-binding MarR family transcriptional regulator
MGIVWELDLAPNKRLVLLAYADHADDEGANVYPSLARIAHKTGYSRDQVRRISKELAADGLMVKVQDATHNRGAEYRLHLERGSKLPPLKKRGGVANDPSGVGAPMPPEPSVEPSVTPTGQSATAQKNWFSFFCELAEPLDIIITPEDRKQTARHFKDLVRLESPSEPEMKKVVSKMLEARTSGYEVSPQKALGKVRGGNVVPFKPKEQEPSRPKKKVIS